MSKYVKSLVTEDLRRRLGGVQDALLVNVVGLDANAATRLRAELRSKGIEVLVIKNSLAARATAGTPLGAMFDELSGTAAICWGGEDIVALAKEVTRLVDSDDFKAFSARGGVIDGERIAAQRVSEVSKWPSRREQLSLLVGQVLSPGARLAGQLTAPGGVLAGQIDQRASASEDTPESPADPPQPS